MNLRKLIQLIRKMCTALLYKLSPFIKSDKWYIQCHYFLHTGKCLNLKHPKTFTEKLQWLKLNDRKENYQQLVDKYEVKSIVAREIGEEHIIPTLGVWDNFDKIEVSQLPNRFVLKTTHDSGGVVVCRDKGKFDWGAARKKLEGNLNNNFYLANREWPYKNVKPRLMAETYIADSGNDDELTDYKFYCFNGKAEFCQVIAGRTSDETIDFYDRNWTHQPFTGLQPSAKKAAVAKEKPLEYDKMLLIADRLAGMVGSAFVRVDLYDTPSGIYFGEITFYPYSGLGQFRPDEWNMKIGNMIKI